MSAILSILLQRQKVSYIVIHKIQSACEYIMLHATFLMVWGKQCYLWDQLTEALKVRIFLSTVS